MGKPKIVGSIEIKPLTIVVGGFEKSMLLLQLRRRMKTAIFLSVCRRRNMGIGDANRIKSRHVPPGIRSFVAIVSALSSEAASSKPILIEEPEAYLHPEIQRLLARTIAEAVNSGKIVVLTTNSDYLISEFNNLIALSNASKDVIKKLGYRDTEVLKPEAVAAYLARVEGNKVVVQRLNVDDGIPEDVFVRVAEEILKVRNEIY
jgi:predicted ATPase